MNEILKAQFFVDDLSDDQKHVITDINAYIKQGLTKTPSSVAIIQGAAGTGKSVVLMELVRQYMTDNHYKTSLVVNHPELYKAYQDIAESIPNMKVNTIRRPTSLINDAQKHNKKYDIIFVDEAHLLYSKSEPYAHYRGQNQLTDLMNLAKVVVVVYDFDQVFQSKMYWDKKLLFDTIGKHPYKTFDMNFQYRMVASDEQVAWMDDLTEEKPLKPFPDNSDFEFKVFDTAGAMFETIKKRNKEFGMSRMVATSGFPRIDGRHNVEMDSFSLPWDEWDPQRTHWAKREGSITQVGTIYTLQGFDLNYVGMIIGPSFGYDPKTDTMTVIPEKYSHKEVFKKRKDIKFTRDEYKTFIANVLNVLMKRGKYGMYLTAYDDALRKRLVKLYKNGK
ncbi:MAG TPA: thymidine kinase [Lactobacillus sp.]|nr:thymidine kinase [Lactobacillus sp.]